MRQFRNPFAHNPLTVASTLFLFLAAELALRTLPTSKAAAMFRTPLSLDSKLPGPPTSFTASENRRMRYAHRVGQHWRGSRQNCLREALVVGFSLRRHKPVLRLGVAPGKGGFIAHAWVEIDGVALYGSEGFTAFQNV